MPLRRFHLATHAFVLAGLLLCGTPDVAQAADARAPATAKPGADRAAYDRIRRERARRREAQARLEQTLAHPPDGAPRWMRARAAERAAKTGAPGANGRRTP